MLREFVELANQIVGLFLAKVGLNCWTLLNAPPQRPPYKFSLPAPARGQIPASSLPAILPIDTERSSTNGQTDGGSRARRRHHGAFCRRMAGSPSRSQRVSVSVLRFIRRSP